MSNYKELLEYEGLLHKLAPEKLAQLQGEVYGLYLASSRHRRVTVDEFAASVLPAIHFNQFRVYRNEKRRAVGWITWAFMTDTESSRYMAGGHVFPVEAWLGGDQLWFMDVIAPFGHIFKIVEDLKTVVFPDRIGFAPDLDNPNGERRVRRFYGANVLSTRNSSDELDFLSFIV